MFCVIEDMFCVIEKVMLPILVFFFGIFTFAKVER